jgi:hypothetical protein
MDSNSIIRIVAAVKIDPSETDRFKSMVKDLKTVVVRLISPISARHNVVMEVRKFYLCGSLSPGTFQMFETEIN